MIWIVLIAGGIYIMVIAFFLYGWEKLRSFTSTQIELNTFVSVIVPMRNEQYTIAGLLDDLCRQNYTAGLYEIIVIDDHSTDQSFQEALFFQKDNVRILSLPENLTGKKAAIRYGIETARGNLIITTDADCHVENNWVQCMAEYFEKFDPVMILGPVTPPKSSPNGEDLLAPYSNWRNNKKYTTFTQLQALELFSLLGSSAGAAANGHPIMCNGGNLAFSKAIYPEIKHLYENEKIHSGDDMFVLLELKKKYPHKIHFLKSKEAIVYTLLINDLASFFKQRKRWAAKAKFYSDYSTILIALIVFSVNTLLMICLAKGFIKNDFSDFLILFVLKSAIDFPLLYRVTAFFGEKRLMRWFPIVQSFYFLYVCFTALAAIITPITWKGRAMKY